MRLIYLLILLAVLTAVVIFAMQNDAEVTLRFLNYSLTTSLALMVGAVYLIGMISGWTVMGILRRSMERVTEGPMYYRQAPAR